jgi:DNA-binding CsgD family transcriptional regulator
MAPNVTATHIRLDLLPSRIGAGAEALLAARGDAGKLQRTIDQSPVPMVMVDGRRRYVEVNRAGLLWFRLSLEEMRAHAIDDLAPADQMERIDRQWTCLLRAGCLAGSHRGAKPNNGRVEVVYYALANVLPGRHAIVFAPADWPSNELGLTDGDGSDPFTSLTAREVEVLTLAADGLSRLEIAREFVLSPNTVSTHFQNIYLKLNVRNRAGAVAKAMRHGLIG